MRIFYGLDLSMQEKQRCSVIAEALRQRKSCSKFVPVENYHITLTFIGEVENVQPYIDIVQKINQSRFTLTTTGELHLFGKTITMLISPNAYIESLKNQLDTLLRNGGLLLEEPHPYRPHITLGRGCKVSESFIETISIQAKKITLFLSEIDGAVVRYKTIDEIDFL